MSPANPAPGRGPADAGPAAGSREPDVPGLLLLGIRHHGPGSARSVAAALAEYKPDCVLIEGPADADPLIGLVAREDLEPPVAILAYREADPRTSAFWPLAGFSPEWVALRHAVDQGTAVGFLDLPSCATLAWQQSEQDGPGVPDPPGAAEFPPAPAAPPLPPGFPGLPALPGLSTPDGPGGLVSTIRPDMTGPADPAGPSSPADPYSRPGPAEQYDPIALLAEAAGHDDPESWWEDAVELRREQGADVRDVFAAVAEAMAEVRRTIPIGEYDLVREAHMRTVLRARIAEGYERIAVVCGAYHVPALAIDIEAEAAAEAEASRGRRKSSAKRANAATGAVAADRALLARIPKPTKATAVALTWVPWTYTRLSYHSGYGAGISSPGWYHHVFQSDEHTAQRWLVGVARLLREERHPVSSAQLIEAGRLAETLAQLRGRPAPGLAELTEAVRAILCEGREEPLALVGRELIVGDVLGLVPEDTPTVPLAADLARQSRRLRVPRSAAAKEYHLDLRTPNDLARSKLFHQLNLLGIDWAVPAGATSTGTFRESWQVLWEPLFEVALAEASCWGGTVAAASTAKALAKAGQSTTLGSLTVIVERCLTAGLPEAVGPLTELLRRRAALDHDLTDLATALPPLANILRYGDVRGVREDEDSARSLGAVVESIGVRLAIGLPRACTGIDDNEAQVFGPLLARVHAAVQILDPDSEPGRSVRGPWFGALHRLADLETAHGLPAGRAVRLLADSGELGRADLAGKLARALARGTEPAAAAAWLDGFLAGTGQILVHDAALLGLIDTWLCALPADLFTAVVPLLRRTFGTFSAGERRAIGGRVRQLGAGPGRSHQVPGEADDGRSPVADPQWAAATRPVVHLLLTGSGQSPKADR
ncbi:MAG TPA: DUF5682 family protein [Actinocrinis sp.]|nr:DUF5682 family protein [Actinocrinis sp.]